MSTRGSAITLPRSAPHMEAVMGASTARSRASGGLSWTTKFGFGLGQTVEVTKIWIFETFVLFYYTQVAGLAPALAGLVLLLSMAVDAITDPLVGQLSDNARSRRWGARHGFMFASLPPAAFFVWMLFSASAAWSQELLFAWMLLACVGLRTALTFFAIPYSAQLADLSSAREERTNLAMMRMLSGTAARFLLILIAFEVFFAAEPDAGAANANPQENASAYFPFSLFAAALIAVTGLLSGLLTWSAAKAVGRKREAAPAGGSHLAGLWRFWRETLARPSNLRTLIVYSLLVAILTGIYGNTILYFGTYYWELTPGQIGVWSQLAIPGMVIAILAGRIVIDRVELKSLLLIAISAYSVTLIAPVLLVELGAYVRTEAIALNVLYAAKLLNGFAFGMLILCVPVMAAETADEWGAKTGRLLPALLFGAIFFTTKAGSGLGGLLAGGVIDVIELPGAAALRVGEASITAGQLSRLGIAYSAAIAALLAAIVTLLWRGYDLDRSRHRELVSRHDEEDPA